MAARGLRTGPRPTSRTRRPGLCPRASNCGRAPMIADMAGVLWPRPIVGPVLELLVARVEATSLRVVIPGDADIPRVRDFVTYWRFYLATPPG